VTNTDLTDDGDDAAGRGIADGGGAWDLGFWVCGGARDELRVGVGLTDTREEEVLTGLGGMVWDGEGPADATVEDGRAPRWCGSGTGSGWRAQAVAASVGGRGIEGGGRNRGRWGRARRRRCEQRNKKKE
jgi:hypothetical protein